VVAVLTESVVPASALRALSRAAAIRLTLLAKSESESLSSVHPTAANAGAGKLSSSAQRVHISHRKRSGKFVKEVGVRVRVCVCPCLCICVLWNLFRLPLDQMPTSASPLLIERSGGGLCDRGRRRDQPRGRRAGPVCELMRGLFWAVALTNQCVDCLSVNTRADVERPTVVAATLSQASSNPTLTDLFLPRTSDTCKHTHIYIYIYIYISVYTTEPPPLQDGPAIAVGVRDATLPYLRTAVDQQQALAGLGPTRPDAGFDSDDPDADLDI
jgi:hypothetical protein